MQILWKASSRRYLVSDFECDSCNEIFGRNEDDLAKFLGTVRTLQSVKGKEKVPKFKATDSKLSMESVEDSVEGTIIEIRGIDRLSGKVLFDTENRRTIITYKKPPYTPLNVYKALLKMALSVVSEKDLPLYKFAFEYLRTTKYDSVYKGFTIIAAYAMPVTFSFTKPLAFLFKKRNPTNACFSHIFYICALNVIYQIIIPFNAKDVLLYAPGNSTDVLWCPPLLGEKYEYDVNTILYSCLDFSSNEKERNGHESFVMPMSAKDAEAGFEGRNITGIDLLRQEL